MAVRFEYLSKTFYDAIEVIAEVSSVMQLLADVGADYRDVKYHVVRLAECDWPRWQDEFIATKTSPVELLGICAASWHMLVDLLRDSVLLCIYESATWVDSQPERDLMSATWLASVDWERSMPELQKNIVARFGRTAEAECYRIQEWMRIEYVQTRLFLLGKDEAFGDGTSNEEGDKSHDKSLHRRGRGRPPIEGKYRELADHWIENQDALKTEFPKMELFVAANLTTGIDGSNPSVEHVRSKLAKLDYKV